MFVFYRAFISPFLCGLSIFCLALLNEIPDFYQDRLVGKRIIPLLSLASVLLLPWLARGLSAVKKDFDNPRVFASAINANVALFLTIAFSLAAGYLIA